MLRPISDPRIAAGTTMSPTMLIPKGTLAAAPIAAPTHPRLAFDIFTTFASSATSPCAKLRRLTVPSAPLTSTWSGSADTRYDPAADDLTAARPHYTLAAIRQTDVGERSSRRAGPLIDPDGCRRWHTASRRVRRQDRGRRPLHDRNTLSCAPRPDDAPPAPRRSPERSSAESLKLARLRQMSPCALRRRARIAVSAEPSAAHEVARRRRSLGVGS